MNVLILSCSSKINLIKSFKTHVNNYGGELVTCDIDKTALGLYFSDKHFICPKSTEQNYIDELYDKCIKLKVKLIIPTRCSELEMLALNKERFKKIDCEIMISNIDTIKICQNKKKFINFCYENNIQVPKTYSLNENIDENKLPLFIKPVIGASSKNTKKIEKLVDLLNVDTNEYIIQEYIDWKEYSIDYLADFDGIYINCIPRERIKVQNGESKITKVFLNDDIINICKKIGTLLKLVGHNTIQCFYNNKEIKIIEINPRFGGASNLGINAGLDSAKILLELLIKKDININTSVKDLVMMRYSKDVFGCFQDNTFIEKSLINTNKIYCIDIDGTICTEMCKYEDAKPINKIINKINKLYKNGNYIKLFTSRGSKSKYDWSILTTKQLEEWNVLYHELIFGKPYADFYIDNKAVDILEWV